MKVFEGLAKEPVKNVVRQHPFTTDSGKEVDKFSRASFVGENMKNMLQYVCHFTILSHDLPIRKQTTGEKQIALS